jgi:hypothetical protein
MGEPLWWFAGVLCFFHCSEFALAWTFSRHEVSWSCTPIPRRFVAIPSHSPAQPTQHPDEDDYWLQHRFTRRLRPAHSASLLNEPQDGRDGDSSRPLNAHRTHGRGRVVTLGWGLLCIAAWLFSTHYCVAMGCAGVEHLLWRALWPSMQQSQAARAISTIGFAFVVLGELVRKAGYVRPHRAQPRPNYRRPRARG